MQGQTHRVTGSGLGWIASEQTSRRCGPAGRTVPSSLQTWNSAIKLMLFRLRVMTTGHLLFGTLDHLPLRAYALPARQQDQLMQPR